MHPSILAFQSLFCSLFGQHLSGRYCPNLGSFAAAHSGNNRVFSGCKEVFQLSRLDSGQVKTTRNLLPFCMKLFHPPLLLQMERCAQTSQHLWPLEELQHPLQGNHYLCPVFQPKTTNCSHLVRSTIMKIPLYSSVLSQYCSLKPPLCYMHM